MGATNSGVERTATKTTKRDIADFAIILDWLSFVEAVNAPPLLSENLIPTEEGWQYNDPGNGEQCVWWCWAIACIRRSLGLPALN